MAWAPQGHLRPIKPAEWISQTKRSAQSTERIALQNNNHKTHSCDGGGVLRGHRAGTVAETARKAGETGSMTSAAVAVTPRRREHWSAHLRCGLGLCRDQQWNRAGGRSDHDAIEIINATKNRFLNQTGNRQDWSQDDQGRALKLYEELIKDNQHGYSITLENQKLASTGNRQLKPHLKSIVIEGEGVLLLKENGCFVLYDKIHERLIPLLENAVSIDTIIQKLSDQYDKIKIYSALIELKQRDLCETTRISQSRMLPSVRNRSWPGKSHQVHEERKVKLIEFGEVDIEPIIETLIEAGICLTDCEDDAFLTLVVCDNYIKKRSLL